jgi:hypothetical protein
MRVILPHETVLEFHLLQVILSASGPASLLLQMNGPNWFFILNWVFFLAARKLTSSELMICLKYSSANILIGRYLCGAVTRVFFTSSYLTLQVNPGAFCYCKGHLNLRLFVRIMLRSIDLKNTRVNGC